MTSTLKIRRIGNSYDRSFRASFSSNSGCAREGNELFNGDHMADPCNGRSLVR